MPSIGHIELALVRRRGGLTAKMIPQLPTPPTVIDVLYEPLAQFMIRVPLLSIDRLSRLITPTGGGGDSDAEAGYLRQVVAQEPDIALAVLIASRSTHDALLAATCPRRANGSLDQTLLRYIIRMATRPTPFGTFAGVGLGQFAADTSAALGSPTHFRRSRPDMSWLLKVRDRLEASPDIRPHLRLVANPAVTPRGTRFVLSPDFWAGPKPGPGTVSLRATRAVRVALDMARSPIPFAHLVSGVAAATQGEAEAARALVSSLVDMQLLLTDLAPPVTPPDWAERFSDRLADLPPTEDRTRLEKLLADLRTCDDQPMESAAQSYAVATGPPNPDAGPETPAIQVDAGLHLSTASVSPQVGADAARAAELLVRLSPFPSGPPQLEAFHKAFVAKYNEGRQVPLLEVLDAEIGLGRYPPDAAETRTLGPAADSRRALLLQLACECVRKRQHTLCLDDDLINSLQTCDPTQDNAPATLDLFVQVAASSPVEIDRGNYQLVVGPSVGSVGAGRALARFAHLHGKTSSAVLTSLGELDDSLHTDVLTVDMVFQPRVARLANVVLRPTHRPHRIDWAGQSGPPGVTLIPPSELVVVSRDGRLRVVWTRAGCEVRVSNGHLLNMTHAPSAARFLSEVAGGGRAQLYGFSWGAAEDFPFLPRIQCGRIVLRLAQWRVPRALFARPKPSPSGCGQPPAAFEEWCRLWSVPRDVYLTYGDNRLLLQLDDPRQATLLCHAAQRLGDGDELLLQEALPSRSDAWVTGPDGAHLSELVIPLKVRETFPPPAASNAVARRAGRAPERACHQAKGSSTDTLKRPGSEWFYAKVYAASVAHDDLVIGPIRDLVAAVQGARAAMQWFFIRYSDPEPHLRLRFKGLPGDLTSRLLPLFYDWVSGFGPDVVSQVSIDTYDREIERYGGPTGIALAEAIFHADSDAVLTYLACHATRQVTGDREDLAVATVDNLLGGLGLDADERIDWLESVVTLSREDGAAYRTRQPVLRRLVRDARGAAGGPPTWAAVLSHAREALGPSSTGWANARNEGRLCVEAGEFLRSIVHMHVNRLLGTDREAERRVLRLLLRTSRSLREMEGGEASAANTRAEVREVTGLSGDQIHQALQTIDRVRRVKS